MRLEPRRNHTAAMIAICVSFSDGFHRGSPDTIRVHCANICSSTIKGDIDSFLLVGGAVAPEVPYLNTSITATRCHNFVGASGLKSYLLHRRGVPSESVCAALRAHVYDP